MAYEPRPGSLSLFKNDRKTQDNHPDYRGDGMDLEGRPVWVSAWLKEGAKGKFFSMSLKYKDAQPDAAPKQGASLPPDFDDSVPFLMER